MLYLDEIFIISADFPRILKHQISWRSFRLEENLFHGTEGRIKTGTVKKMQLIVTYHNFVITLVSDEYPCCVED